MKVTYYNQATGHHRMIEAVDFHFRWDVKTHIAQCFVELTDSREIMFEGRMMETDVRELDRAMVDGRDITLPNELAPRDMRTAEQIKEEKSTTDMIDYCFKYNGEREF